MRRWMIQMGALSLCVTLSSACGPTTPPPSDQSQLDADPPLTDGPKGPVADADLQRGIAYLKNEKFADAKPYLEKAVGKNPKNAEATFYLAVAQEKTGDKQGAEGTYKKALALDAKLTDAAVYLAAMYLDDPPRPDEAIPVLESALKTVPDDAGLNQNLGYAYSLKGDVDRAAKAYEKALAKNDTAELRLALGTMFIEAKQPDRAAEHLKKALDKTKDDAGMLVTLGRMLAFTKSYGECVKALDRALKIKPGDPEWLVRRGTCRHELKDEPGARADYEAAIKADPKFAAGHYYLGLSFLEEKKRQQAFASLETAAKVGGDSKIGKAAREKLDTLKGAKK